MTEPVDRKSEVSAFFAKNASSWRTRYGVQGFDEWEYQTRGRIALEWLTELRTSSPGRLLEIGCGAGVQSIAAAQVGWNVTSVDFADGMLAEARRQSQEPKWVAAAVEALPFRPHSFDIVLMNGVIGYVNDPMQALRAVHDQLRPGGRFIVSWASPHPLLLERVSKRVSAVPDAVYLGLKRLVTGRANPTDSEGPGFYDQYLRRWRPGIFYEMLESTGFSIERVRSQNFGRMRFMDRPIWPEQMDIRLSEWLDDRANAVPRRPVRDGARTHIAQVIVPA